ncbi:MAG: YMGG-like glycine zipper-containing protein [Nitrospira sp.]|nr:YMGG-like glycine zipper-containing protein [Nitrospira sp.]
MIRALLVAVMPVLIALIGFSSDIGAQMFVYPEKGQTKDQQELDQFTCYKWAKEQTGIDPYRQTAAAPPPPEGGQAVRGAARGAALGAVGGAIGGNAGKGAAIGAAVGGGAGMMRRRRAEMEYEHQVEEQAADRQAAQQTFNRAYGVCLEGKGYKVG